jgi:uncharacterized RDD family membrane protein YckC
MKTLLFPGASRLGLLFALVIPVQAVWAQPGSPPADERNDFSWPDYRGGAHHGNRVQVMSSNHIEADEKVAGDVVSVMGGNVVDGMVSHDVRAVMGNNVVNGTVGHDVITVMGETTINGTVDHNVRGTMGGITLGPNAVVRGDIINVGGSLHRDPGAVVRGRVINQSFDAHHRFEPNVTWRHEDGRSDWAELVHNFLVAWRWVFTLIFIGFYALVTLVFPGAVRRCGDVLVERPGLTVLVSFAALLAVPLVFLLLLVTIIGIPVAILLLPCALIACLIMGKAGFYGLVGRSITSGRLQAAGAVLLGGALCAVFYFIPILGIVLSVFVSILGFGCGMTALLTRSRGTPPPPPAPRVPSPVAPAPPPAPVAEPPLAMAQALDAPPPPTVTPAAAPGIAAGEAPAPAAATPIYSAALPRAGFWIRIGALCIDGLIISAIFGDAVWNNHLIHEGFHLSGSNCLLPLAIYAALMWKFKGTTIGGMICGLRVARLDDAPVGWETAIVRALGCFLSAFFALGFIWIALDPEKQAWHDKIAGTVVVRTKGVSLV